MCKSKLGKYFTFVFSLLFVFCTTISMAQTDRVIRGTVVDATTGAPLGGVSISDSATKNATSTGSDGSFEIGTRTNSTLSFRFIGFITQTVQVGNQTSLRIELAEDAADLEEVVVVAYGTAKKRDLTGSVSTIDSKVLANQSNSSVSRALEGAAPGIQVSAVDGQPGLDMGIRVRGLGSANQNTSMP